MFEEAYRLYDYYSRMEDKYWNTGWDKEEEIVKYSQFRWLRCYYEKILFNMI